MNNLLNSTKKKIQKESIAALTAADDAPKKKRLNVDLDEETMKRFKGKCGLEGKKINEVVVGLINEYLSK